MNDITLKYQFARENHPVDCQCVACNPEVIETLIYERFYATSHRDISPDMVVSHLINARNLAYTLLYLLLD